MKFRRSIKNEKHENAKSSTASVAQKDAVAIQPPKKVIKALYDHQAEGDPKIYLSFSAGDFLHVVGRENDEDWYEACNPLIGSRGLVPAQFFSEVGKTVRHSDGSTKSNGGAHDSGFAENASRTSTAATSAQPTPGHRSSKSIAKAMGGVYGVVAYDFKAERPDELDAKEGEAIIVIAQSNPEWFVAKPITRLGGPGLIPVSFIEIRDMTTGKPVEDPLAAVASAGIPKVEEWKKMAAEYKNTSIPLGTVTSTSAVQNMTNAMSRASISGTQGQQPSYQSGMPHQRQPSTYNHQQQQTLFAPVRASVPRFVYSDEKFHFVVECKLSDGTHWDLSRVYEDFYELQINLINAFPEEAGQVHGKPRILPYMPGPVKYVTDNISEGRRISLDDYLRKLLGLQPNVTCSSLVRSFFTPRNGDTQVDSRTVNLEAHARPSEVDNRYSTASATSYQHGAHGVQTQDSSAGYGHQSQSTISSINHARPPSDYPQSSHTPSLVPPLTRQTTSTSASSSGPPIKVKVWFDRDTCVVIRMGPRGQFTYDDLHRKVAERRQLEYKGEVYDELHIEYRDELDGNYYSLEGDDDLDIAMNRCEKLTLAVRPPSVAD